MATVNNVMEDHPSTVKKMRDTAGTQPNNSRIHKSTEVFKKRFQSPFGKELASENDHKILQQKLFDEIQVKKGKTEDLQISEGDVKSKQTLDSSIVNIKNSFKRSYTTSVPNTIITTLTKDMVAQQVSATKIHSLTQRPRPPQTQNKTLEKSSRKSKSAHSSQHIARASDHKINSKITSINENLKRSTSFQPFISKEKKMRSDNTIQVAPKDNQSFVLTNAHNIGRKSPAVRLSLDILSKVKPASPTPRQRAKNRPHSVQKLSKPKEKIYSSDTEHKPTGIKDSYELVQLSQKLISSEELQQRSKKSRSKSRKKMKNMSSEPPNQRDLRQSSRKLSTPKLHILHALKSPKLISTPRISEVKKSVSSPQPQRALKLSKSATFPKRSNTISQSQESKLALRTRKTKSTSKLNERMSQLKISTAKDSSTKLDKVTPSSPYRLILTSKLLDAQLSKRPSKKRSISGSRVFETASTLENAKPRQDKSKNKTSNANANNMNDVSDKEKSPSSSAIISTEGETERSVSRITTSCLPSIQNVLNSGVVSGNENQPCRRKYTPQPLFQQNIAKLLNESDENKMSYANRNQSLKRDVYDNEEKDEISKYRGFYKMFFMDLVKQDVSDGKEMERPVQIEPVIYSKNKVRFNLQSSEHMSEVFKPHRVNLRRTWSGYEFKKYQSPGMHILQFSNSREMNRYQKPSPSLKIGPQSVQSVKMPDVTWSNLWTTILKSKKWQEIHSNRDPVFHYDDDTDVQNKENIDSSDVKSFHSTHEIGSGLYKDSKDSIPNCNTADDWESPLSVRNRRKNRKARCVRRKSRTVLDESPQEMVFPPYKLNSLEDSNSVDGCENSKNVVCDFVQSEMTEFNDNRNSVEAADVSVSNLLLGTYRKNPMVQLKWINLVDFVTKEVKKECHTKGYEFLQRLSRGMPRVHSLIFLANNKNNPEYTPVEVTAIRLPYAYFTSSVACLSGPASERQYAHTWITSLPPHSNLVMLLHRLCTTNWVYHVTEHCPWPSLSQLLNQSQRHVTNNNQGTGLKENVCKTIFRQICAGMDHLHQNDVLHGDLSCFNVLVSSTLQVKLAGYGPMCHRMISPLQTIKGHIPLQGDAYSVCTPPELLARKDTWTKNCDVWCMGITLLQMVIGDIPHEINSAIRLSGSSNPVSRLHLPACGYQLSRLIDKILQPCASNRPSVFHICNHPWVSDGTELVTLIAETTNKLGTRRTDGATFPLPKRLQNKELTSQDADCSHCHCDGDLKCMQTESEGIIEDSFSIHRNIPEEPSIFDRSFCGSKLYQRSLFGSSRRSTSKKVTASAEFCHVRQEETSSHSLNTKADLPSSDSFLNLRTDNVSSESRENEDDNPEINPERRGEECDTQVGYHLPKLNVPPDKELIKNTGCDLLKLMEILTLYEETSVPN